MSVDAPETGETTETYDDALEAGYWGTHPDPEPNESYTVAGQVEAPPEQTTSSSKASTSKPSSKASDSS